MLSFRSIHTFRYSTTMQQSSGKNWYQIARYSFESLFGMISVIMIVIWLIVVVYRFIFNLARYKQLSNTHPGNQDSYRRNAYNLRTFIVRDIFLVLTIIVEISTLTFSVLTYQYLYNEILNSHKVFHQISNHFGCHVQPLIGFSYMQPSFLLFFIPISIGYSTLLMFLSYINSYLAARYLGHSLPNKYKKKYVFWWVIQCIVQLICIYPKFQLLFFTILDVFFFFNWIYVVSCSRKVMSAIKSRIDEIRYFEWNSAHMGHLRRYTTNLKHYKTTMRFMLCAIFILIVLFTVTIVTLYLELFLLGDCYFHEAFGINISIHISTPKQYMKEAIKNVYDWLTLIIFILFGIIFTMPSLVLFSVYLLNYLYSYITGKVNMQKYNNALFEPLLSIE